MLSTLEDSRHEKDWQANGKKKTWNNTSAPPCVCCSGLQSKVSCQKCKYRELLGVREVRVLSCDKTVWQPVCFASAPIFKFLTLISYIYKVWSIQSLFNLTINTGQARLGPAVSHMTKHYFFPLATKTTEKNKYIRERTQRPDKKDTEESTEAGVQ